jgi:uncharacterized protein (DUF1800 family)
MLNALPASKWNYATAAHLCSRAGFGGAPEEIEKLAAMTPGDAVDSFINFDKIPVSVEEPSWAKPNPELAEQRRKIQRLVRDEQEKALTDDEKRALEEKRREIFRDVQRQQVRNLQELRYGWLNRMATGPRPFQEKLTLFWHGHFATSAVKVRDAYYMWRQIDTFRRKGSGNWLELLEAVATDPAMLIWLDQAQSRRQHPNENFARECMELFALGEGHYTEKDVTEAARAMTGWSLDPAEQDYIYRPRIHDDGIKTVLGKTGNLTGRDVLEIIVAQPQAARFITAKLWKFFGSENLDPKLAEAMAQEFRSNGNNFGPFLRTMFASEEFYAPSVMGSQVKSPVQWLVGSVRLLQRNLPPSIVSTQMIKNLGQDLLLPPNVKGWDGGLSWITTNTLLARYNQAAILVMGQGNLGANAERPGMQRLAERANEMARNMRPADVEHIVPDADRRSHDAVLAAIEKRFLLSPLSEKHRQSLRDYLEPRSELDDQDVRHVIRRLMSTPEYQVT